MDVASEMAYPSFPSSWRASGRAPERSGWWKGWPRPRQASSRWWGEAFRPAREEAPLPPFGLRPPRPVPAPFGPGAKPLPRPPLPLPGPDRKGPPHRPRDALIAESAPKEALGRAYGLHRSLDTLGATLGPFLAFLLLPLLGFRGVFWLSALPALLAFLLLFAVRETPRPPSPLPPLALGHLSPGYRRFLLVSGLFALALSSNAFLLLRLKELGLSQEEVALAYTLYNLLYALLAYPLGGLADRVGLGRMVATGFGLYALVYLGFAWARTAFWALGFLFLYALYSAAFEGANRAYLATLVPEEAKAGAIGLYHTVVGVLLLPASLLFGLLWQAFGAAAAFLTGAALALGALLLFLVDGTGRRAYPG